MARALRQGRKGIPLAFAAGLSGPARHLTATRYGIRPTRAIRLPYPRGQPSSAELYQARANERAFDRAGQMTALSWDITWRRK